MKGEASGWGLEMGYWQWNDLRCEGSENSFSQRKGVWKAGVDYCYTASSGVLDTDTVVRHTWVVEIDCTGLHGLTASMLLDIMIAFQWSWYFVLCGVLGDEALRSGFQRTISCELEKRAW